MKVYSDMLHELINDVTPALRISFEENLRRTWPHLAKLLIIIGKENSVLLHEISILLPTKGFLFEDPTPHFFHFLFAFLNNKFGFIETPLNGPLWEMYGYFLESHNAKQKPSNAVLYQNMTQCSLGS